MRDDITNAVIRANAIDDELTWHDMNCLREKYPDLAPIFDRMEDQEDRLKDVVLRSEYVELEDRLEAITERVSDFCNDLDGVNTDLHCADNQGELADALDEMAEVVKFIRLEVEK